MNKITKLYLKKEAKEVSDVVLYKLTEATDESLKENPELTPELTKMCYGNDQVIQIWRIGCSIMKPIKKILKEELITHLKSS